MFIYNIPMRLIYVLVFDRCQYWRFQTTSIPNQLSSFPAFNYGRRTKIAVSSTGLRQIYRSPFLSQARQEWVEQTSAGTNMIARP